MPRDRGRKRSAVKEDNDEAASSTLPRGSTWTSRLAETVDWNEMWKRAAFAEFQKKPPVGRTPGTEDCVMRRVFDLLSTQDVGVVTQFFGLRGAPLDDQWESPTPQ